jgi:hypothetical protein
MRDHTLYYLRISLTCSVFSRSFSDDSGFPLFPDLVSEAQEAQVARLFLFSCPEALLSPDIPDLFSFCFLLLFPFLICVRIRFGTLCARFVLSFFPCIFDELTTDRNARESTLSGDGTISGP